MSRSLYEDTFRFLRNQSTIEVKNNHLRRLKVLAKMISSCAKTKHCSLSGLSGSSAPDTRQSESCIKQVKRWLCSKWTDWDSFFALYTAYLLTHLAKNGHYISAF